MTIQSGLDAGTEAVGKTTSQRIAAKRRQTRQRRVLRWLWAFAVRTMLLLLLVTAVAVGSLLAFEQFFATRVYPQMSIHGAPVGMLSRTEASTAVYKHHADFLNQPVTLTYGDMTWTPTLADLGVSLDVDGAVQAALATGRHPELEDRLRAAAALWENGLELPLQVTVDQTAMQQYLLRSLSEIERKPTDARFIMEGTALDMVSATPGRQLLLDPTLRDITAAVQTLEPRAVAIRTRPLAPVLDDAAVAQTRETVETLLQAPLRLRRAEDDWLWTQEDLAKLVIVERATNEQGPGDHLVVRLDEERIRQHIHWYAVQTERPGTHPRVDWNGGNMTIIRAGVPGARINESKAVDMILEAIWTPNRIIELPFEAVPVPSTSQDLAQLGINEVISVGRTSFEDSEDYRVTNIIAGMRLLHGVLLAPGEEFSFNQTIGSIGAENGFVEGYAIVDDETQLEWGGGICQDSTTMFRAAFWAGLPITERWNHSKHISWYDEYGYGNYGNGPGLDSTIFLGGPDLKFVNDTGNWILIQAYANPATEIAEIVFYGTRGGRTVEFEGPTISYISGGRMEVAFTRIIKQDGIETRRVTYWSTYKPW